MLLSIFTTALSKSIPLYSIDLEELLFSEPVENITDGINDSSVPWYIGFVYAPCPNGAATIGNEPSSEHSTLTNLE